MMKILILNPHIDASHEVTRALQGKGHAVLLTLHPDEAMQVFQLHSSTVDLVIVHREITESLSGLQFLDRLRASYPETASIVTSEKWGEEDFFKHQATASGANAYVRSPFSTDLLLSVIEQIFSTESASPNSAPSLSAPSLEVPAGGHVLESSPEIFRAQNTPSAETGGIFLESPLDLTTESSLESHSASSNLSLPENAVSFPSVSSPHAYSIEGQNPLSEGLPVQIEPNAESVGLSTGVSPQEAPPFFEFPKDEEALELAGGTLQIPGQNTGDAQGKTPESPAASDPEAAREMPYLFAKAWGQSPSSPPAFAQAMGDAVIPGGAANTPDVETLKKYLMLREQDVAVLSTQLKTLKDQLADRERTLNEQRAANTELTHQIMERGLQIEEYEREKSLARNALEKELNELKFQNKAKVDRARVLEKQVQEAAAEIERLKDRVRTDIRKIRVREKELENRLEIMKKDSEALIGARETKIIELKRKLDLLEFNMDLLQDQYVREKENSAKTRQLLAKAAQVVRVAGGLLDLNPDTGTLETPGEELAQQIERESEKAS